MEKVKKVIPNRPKSSAIHLSREKVNLTKKTDNKILVARISSAFPKQIQIKIDRSHDQIKIAAPVLKIDDVKNILNDKSIHLAQNAELREMNQKKFLSNNITKKIVKNLYHITLYATLGNKSNLLKLATEILHLEALKLPRQLHNLESLCNKFIAHESKCFQFSNDNITEQFNLIQSLNYILEEVMKEDKDKLFSFLLDHEIELYWMINYGYFLCCSNKSFFELCHQYLYTPQRSNYSITKIFKNTVKLIKPKLVKRTCEKFYENSFNIDKIKEEIKHFGNSVETVEFSFESETLPHNEFLNFITQLITVINENTNLNKVKNIYIELVIKKVYHNITEFNEYLNLNKSRYTDLVQGKHVFLRFTIFNQEKHHITSFIEKKLHFDKVRDSYYNLLFCKYSETSVLKKMHKFILKNVFLFIMDLSTINIEEGDVKIIHTLKREEKMKKSIKTK